MINILENHCIQAIAYNIFLICLSKYTKVHYNNEIVEKFHTNMAGKTLCTYVLMSKK